MVADRDGRLVAPIGAGQPFQEGDVREQEPAVLLVGVDELHAAERLDPTDRVEGGLPRRDDAVPRCPLGDAVAPADRLRPGTVDDAPELLVQGGGREACRERRAVDVAELAEELLQGAALEVELDDAEGQTGSVEVAGDLLVGVAARLVIGDHLQPGIERELRLERAGRRVDRQEKTVPPGLDPFEHADRSQGAGRDDGGLGRGVRDDHPESARYAARAHVDDAHRSDAVAEHLHGRHELPVDPDGAVGRRVLGRPEVRRQGGPAGRLHDHVVPIGHLCHTTPSAPVRSREGTAGRAPRSTSFGVPDARLFRGGR